MWNFLSERKVEFSLFFSPLVLCRRGRAGREQEAPREKPLICRYNAKPPESKPRVAGPQLTALLTNGKRTVLAGQVQHRNAATGDHI
ncbi:hypothetical protein GN956_G15079 [Arapaima gigas]